MDSAFTATPEVKNAIIESVSITSERLLSAWVHLDYGGSGQGFGGFALGGGSNWANQPNFAGRFILRVMEVVGVEEWSHLPGRAVRVMAEHGKVHSIGHIIKDQWFNPSEEFDAAKKEPTNG